MTSNEEPSADDAAPNTLPGQPPGRASPPGLGTLNPDGAATPLARRTRFAASRRRPWWKWLLIGLLLLCSLAVTILYAAALITDISRHHWAGALDDSRDAVPAVVGWAALVIVFFTGGTAAAERMLSVDNYALGEKEKRNAKDQDSVASAEQRVQVLTAKLEGLTAGRQHAGRQDAGRQDAGTAAETVPDRHDAEPARHNPELDQEVAETTARLEQARQWLTSARAALATSRLEVAEAEDKLASDFPDPAQRPDPARGKPA
jgi:hypothetical protein